MNDAQLQILAEFIRAVQDRLLTEADRDEDNDEYFRPYWTVKPVTGAGVFIDGMDVLVRDGGDNYMMVTLSWDENEGLVLEEFG